MDAAGTVLRPGDIVAQTRQVAAQIGDVLAELGADCDDVVKLNRWYAGDVGIADFEPAALACAAHFPRARTRLPPAFPSRATPPTR